jgi:hypothetical protein
VREVGPVDPYRHTILTIASLHENVLVRVRARLRTHVWVVPAGDKGVHRRVRPALASH